MSMLPPPLPDPDYDDHKPNTGNEGYLAPRQNNSYKGRASNPHRFSMLPMVNMPLTLQKGMHMIPEEEEDEDRDQPLQRSPPRRAKAQGRIAMLQRMLADSTAPAERQVHQDFRADKMATLKPDVSAPRAKDKISKPLYGNELPDVSKVFEK